MVKKEYLIVSGNLGAVRQLTGAGYRLQTARELQNDRCKDGQESLQNEWFYVADGSVFYRDQENGVLSWAHADGEHNLIIQPQYLEGALRDLPTTQIFRPDTAQESWDAIKNRSTKRFSLSDLELVRENDEFSFMPIKTGKYDALSLVQQKAASSVGFIPKNVAYLKQKGIKETRLWLLNPKYVAQVLAGGEDPFWRASWLNFFDDLSSFNADGRGVDLVDRLRGVRRGASVSEPVNVRPQGDATKNVELRSLDDVLTCLDNFVSPAIKDKLKELYGVQ